MMNISKFFAIGSLLLNGINGYDKSDIDHDLNNFHKFQKEFVLCETGCEHYTSQYFGFFLDDARICIPVSGCYPKQEYEDWIAGAFAKDTTKISKWDPEITEIKPDATNEYETVYHVKVTVNKEYTQDCKYRTEETEHFEIINGKIRLYEVLNVDIKSKVCDPGYGTDTTTKTPTTSTTWEKSTKSPIPTSPNTLPPIPTPIPTWSPVTPSPTTTTTTKPTPGPTANPTPSPTRAPTLKPTTPQPTDNPTPTPTWPTAKPTVNPTTSQPTAGPTAKPTTASPTPSPTTLEPTPAPTSGPTAKPTDAPTPPPSPAPSSSPTTEEPTDAPTPQPTTGTPTAGPTATVEPTFAPAGRGNIPETPTRSPSVWKRSTTTPTAGPTTSTQGPTPGFGTLPPLSKTPTQAPTPGFGPVPPRTTLEPTTTKVPTTYPPKKCTFDCKRRSGSWGGRKLLKKRGGGKNKGGSWKKGKGGKKKGGSWGNSGSWSNSGSYDDEEEECDVGYKCVKENEYDECAGICVRDYGGSLY